VSSRAPALSLAVGRAEMQPHLARAAAWAERAARCLHDARAYNAARCSDSCPRCLEQLHDLLTRCEADLIGAINEGEEIAAQLSRVIARGDA
jgi:hypothetical protein